MKAKELRERSDQDLRELSTQLERDLFGMRMKNFTGQLDDTSQLGKARRDLARIALVLGERAQQSASKEAQQAGSDK